MPLRPLYRDALGPPELERHRIRYGLNGFPIYSYRDHGREQTLLGHAFEAKWQWADMSEELHAAIWRLVDAGVVHFTDRPNPPTRLQTLALVLEEYGIACWHPAEHRRAVLSFGRPLPGVWECGVCDIRFVPASAVEEARYAAR